MEPKKVNEPTCQSIFHQVSAIEAKVEHEAEFDNMEVINEKQENNKEGEVNGDNEARCGNSMQHYFSLN